MARIQILTAVGLAAMLAFAAAAEAGTSTTRTVVKTERVYLQLSGMGWGPCAVDVTAALRRVRGVQSATVDRRRDEATVIRRQGQASDQELVSAVRRVGYSASVIPVKRVTLSVSNMDRQGSSERLTSALRRVSGVREVSLSGQGVAKVSYDNRRTSESGLIQACRRAGFPATTTVASTQPTRTRTTTVRSTPVRRTAPSSR